MLLDEAAKLSCRDVPDLTLIESASLDARVLSGLAVTGRSGNAQGKPLVGAAAIGSGMPETLRGLGLMTGARRGALFARAPARLSSGERGALLPL